MHNWTHVWLRTKNAWITQIIITSSVFHWIKCNVSKRYIELLSAPSAPDERLKIHSPNLVPMFWQNVDNAANFHRCKKLSKMKSYPMPFASRFALYWACKQKKEDSILTRGTDVLRIKRTSTSSRSSENLFIHERVPILFRCFPFHSTSVILILWKVVLRHQLRMTIIKHNPGYTYVGVYNCDGESKKKIQWVYKRCSMASPLVYSCVCVCVCFWMYV